VEAEEYRVKPGLLKGGKGRLAKVASPCDFQIFSESHPILRVIYCPPGSGLMSLLATIVTGIALYVIPQLSSFLAIPSFFIWYYIISNVRHQEVKIDLAKADRIVADAKKREISILDTVAGKRAMT